MPDFANSTRTARQAIPAPAEAPPRPLPEGLSRLTKTDAPLYSIRFADSPGTLCAACGKQDTGAGPVAFLDEDPICDLCLLEGSHQLGMVLAVVAVTRAYAGVKDAPLEERQAALEELGAFARVYETFAAKSWPARTFRILPDFTRPDDSTH